MLEESLFLLLIIMLLPCATLAEGALFGNIGLLSETGCTSFDKDPEAHDHATRTFQDNRFTFMPKGFEDLDQLENISIFQGFLFDLGVCSSHFDNSLRGLVSTRMGTRYEI